MTDVPIELIWIDLFFKTFQDFLSIIEKNVFSTHEFFLISDMNETYFIQNLFQ